MTHLIGNFVEQRPSGKWAICWPDNSVMADGYKSRHAALCALAFCIKRARKA